MKRAASVFLIAALCALLVSCSEEGGTPDQGAKDSSPTADAGSDASGDLKAPDAQADSAAPTAKICKDLALTPRPFNTAGPYGYRRHSLVEDFTLKLQDGSSWNLRSKWTGCESYIFIPDTLKSNQRATSGSVWLKDLSTLVAYSPLNAHYFFIGRSAAAKSGTVLKEMQDRVTKALQALDATKKAHWQERLHVVATHSEDLKGWMKDVVNTGVGYNGFAIDRSQRLRGLGSLADVHRYSASLKSESLWPWEANLAYAAHEAMYYNYEAKRQARLDAEKVTEVKFWKGEVIQEYAEMEVTLPAAAEMAKFDTLELDVTQRCPKESSPEFGNCGAWDYISHLGLKDSSSSKLLELARLITTYHREGRWLVDITPMLVRLAQGGKQTFRWTWAPSWNKQPTATWLSLRFSNRGKGMRPKKLISLFQGGSFNDTYNASRKPMEVDVPAAAKKVELWALISGHGQSSIGCAEFCNHQHRFVVNGTVFLKQYPEASNKDGCMKRIDQGVVPNQWGTWWLGRGGWCPGQQVPPYQVDVTSAAPAGKKATISYTGLYNGSTPPALSSPGNINLQSYVVVYE